MGGGRKSVFMVARKERIAEQLFFLMVPAAENVLITKEKAKITEQLIRARLVSTTVAITAVMIAAGIKGRDMVLGHTTLTGIGMIMMTVHKIISNCRMTAG